MTLSLNTASRFSLVATAALALGATVAPIASQAAAPYYAAKLAAPADDDRAVAAREFGEVTSFTAKGKELSADKLAKCNGK